MDELAELNKKFPGFALRKDAETGVIEFLSVGKEWLPWPPKFPDDTYDTNKSGRRLPHRCHCGGIFVRPAYQQDYVCEFCGEKPKPIDPPQGLANLGYNISLRDIFAGQAMAALININHLDGRNRSTQEIASIAYEQADEMLEARNK